MSPPPATALPVTTPTGMARPDAPKPPRSRLARARATVSAWLAYASGRSAPPVVAVSRPTVPLADAPLDMLAAKILFSHARNRQQLLGPPPTAFGQLDAPQIELLAAATVVAAEAGGPLTDSAERQLRSRLSSAGLLGDDAEALARLLRAPPAIDTLLRQVRDPHVASLFYAASVLGADRHDPSGQAWLHYLASRLRLPAATLERLHSQYGAA